MYNGLEGSSLFIRGDFNHYISNLRGKGALENKGYGVKRVKHWKCLGILFKK